MTHSCIRYIDTDSPPRILWYGEQFLIEHLPVGTRCIYPKPPMEGLKDPDAAIRYAINHPENSEPLHAHLFPGMKVTVAFDDVSVPLPPMRKPDVRQRMLEIVLEVLADHGVDDIHIIAALAVHRRMTDSELKHTVGERIFSEYHPDRLYNHDAEDPEGMVRLGMTDHDEAVSINKRAADSDLIIYVNVNFVPMDGGHKSVAVGLCGYDALRAHHNPKTLHASNSYMDPPNSELHHSVDRQGRVVNKELNVFTIETVLNNKSFGGQLDFLQKHEEDLSDFEWQKMRAVKATLDRLPQRGRQELLYASAAPYEMISVHAGETEAVHKKTLEKAYEQYAVPVKGQSDIVIFGVPFISPYNIHSYLNPLLVQVMAQGYLHNLYRGVPLLKEGGTLVITHPMDDRFDPVQHPAYIEFVHRLLPETRDAFELHKNYEKSFAEDPTYVEMYRRGNAYHGSHPFFMWYWGEAGRKHTGRVIVAGAKDDYMCELFGYEPAPNLQEAISMARDTAPASPDISLFTSRSIYLCDVTPDDDAGASGDEAA